MVPFWSRKSDDPVIEDAEQTLHRLQTEAERRSRMPSNSRSAPVPGLRVCRGGYDMDEVDAFLATIDRRTAGEIKDVTFNYRRKQGYHQDDVDQLLDDWIGRAAQEPKSHN
jgi:DivIVA domain-containing protein